MCKQPYISPWFSFELQMRPRYERHSGGRGFVVIPFFTEKSARAALNAWERIRFESPNIQKERKLAIYCNVANYLLSPYTINEVIDGAESKIHNFFHRIKMSAVEYDQSL